MIEPIAPDRKNWTWVLQRPCPECGLDVQRIPANDIPRLVRDNAATWQPVLTGPHVRDRPRPDVWSPLEYACHVRDVFRLYDERLVRMLVEDDPLFADWDQDATAVAEDYAAQDPVAVAPALQAAGEALAARFAQVRGQQWQRPGRRTDGACFTVLSLARYLLHDPVHHLRDVGV